MYELTPFERRSRNFAKYFDQLEKNFFGDNSRALSEIKTDIIDKVDHYLLQAELAGFNKEDIHEYQMKCLIERRNKLYGLLNGLRKAERTYINQIDEVENLINKCNE